MKDWKKTLSLIPEGVQTLSKRPCCYVDDVYPKYIDRGQAAYVFTDDERYIDYTMGLGAVLLGHSYQTVTDAVCSQAKKGVLFGLPNYAETVLAEKICEIVPCAEMVRFVKTGSETTSAAVKIARAYTNRPHVIACGYHGWHEWYNWTTPNNAGCAPQPVTRVEYNDYVMIDRIFDSNSVAAVIMEPYILEKPKHGFLKLVRSLCDRKGAVLIFDEVITGFRTKTGTAQKFFDVTPDLTCLGKALGNGFAIGCVCGKRELMKVLEDKCFVSSTFGGELTGIAAGLAVIEAIERGGVIQHIWEMGQLLKDGFNNAAQALDLDAECIGYPCRTKFVFPTDVHLSLFWQECLKRGVFFGHAQFISYAHDKFILEKTLDVVRESLEVVAGRWDEPKQLLRGHPTRVTR